jgi:hypothetical protein
MKKTFLTFFSLCLIGYVASAQTWDNSGDSWDNSGDSWDNSGGTTTDYDYDPGSGSGTMGDSTSVDDWGGGSWDQSGFDYSSGGQDYVRTARPTVESKPYERFTGMPFDSAAELVTYVEIVEVILPDEYLGDNYTTSDSLYARALKWMQLQFGEKEAKKMIEAAGQDPKGREGQTIKAIVVMPLVVEINEYSRTTAGVIQFDMELRFKDERYRYKFDNFVHVTPDKSGGKAAVRTYMEYYMTAKQNTRNNDKILMATNNQMNKLIDGLKQSCEIVPFIDDDDW